MEEKIAHWPPWIEVASNLSHLLTVFNSSVNFYIYLAKHPTILPCCRRVLRARGRHASGGGTITLGQLTTVQSSRMVEMENLASNGKQKVGGKARKKVRLSLGNNEENCQ